MKKNNNTNRTSIWVRIVSGICLVALIVGFNACKNKDNETAQNKSADLISVHENNSTVSAFTSFIANDKNKMTLDHAYTNEALLKLTDAVNAMANEINYSVEGDISEVKKYADKITNDPFETTHANDIRMSTDIMTNVLQNMQQAKFPGLANDITALRSASASIKPDVLTLDQRDAVKSFFGKAADLLEKMN